MDLEWLHSDTTSVYFEGAYEDDNGEPKGGQEGVPMLVDGYNKDGKRNKVQFVLSLTTSGRVPLWYNPYNGNQTDDAVYLKDLSERTVLVPQNAVFIGDRKLCNQQTMLGFCRRGQQFLAPHPWTEKAKTVWLSTSQQLEAGELSWQEVVYASRNDARKPPDKRPRHRVCEVEHELEDPQEGRVYPLRWVFCWASKKAQQDADKRNKALLAGEEALRRAASLVGKYDYTNPRTIQARIDKALEKAKAKNYFSYRLIGRGKDQVEALFWERQEEAIAQDERFDGVALICANVPKERLCAGEVMVKHKQQVGVEQTIDFIYCRFSVGNQGALISNRGSSSTLLYPASFGKFRAPCWSFRWASYLSNSCTPWRSFERAFSVGCDL